MFLFGVSLGAVIVSKYMIENSGKTPIKAIALYGIQVNLAP
jgi:hypothetical protein